MKILLIIAFSAVTVFSSAQNLLHERIMKLSDRKRSIFLEAGVFHHLKNDGTISGLTGIRNSYVQSRGYERLVIDFNSASVPQIYGHMSSKNNTLSIDLGNTKLAQAISNLSGTKFIKNMDVVSIDEKNITVVVTTKDKVSYDVFYLENPGRLVIDIKK